MNTRINELLGCKYPILMGGMQWITKSEFVNSIVDSGGFGFISASSFASPEDLARDIIKLKALSKRPIGVNISMLPGEKFYQKIDRYLEIVIKEKAAVLETSGNNPKDIIERVKPYGIRVFHKVTDPRHAASAEKAGADAIIAVGYEAAGHPGMGQVGTFVNLPAIIKAVKLPVIAAGGIYDGKGMASAFSFGAEGVLMGTRFLATRESPVHDDLKRWIVNASEKDTLIIQRTLNHALRCIANKQAYRVLGVEAANGSFEMLYPLIKGKLGETAWYSGEFENAILAMGQAAGLIEDVPSMKELIEGIVRDFYKIVISMRRFAD